MIPYQITINNQPATLGASLPSSITHLSIIFNPMFQLPVEKSQTPLIKQWLNKLIDNLDCEFVTYNNTLIPSSELQKFKL